jgi:hypothetical protein
MKMRIINCIGVLVLCLLSTLSCSDSTKPAGPGRLRLFLTDTPAAYDQVNIVVTKVDVHLADSDSLTSWTTVNDDSSTYNLLTLRNGANALLGDTTLTAAKYTQVRLYVGEGSNVVVDGVTHSLDISANNTVKLNHNFEIAPAMVYLLILDFDAARSIVKTGVGEYKLTPVIRIGDLDSVGSISGIVTPFEARAEVATLVGVDTITAFCDTTTGVFRLPIIPAGTYSLNIASTYLSYSDSTITGVAVVKGYNTNIGTVVLRLLP